MKNIQQKRKSSIHLYNPKEEGLGIYDIHYMNAYKKKKNTLSHLNTNQNNRSVA